MIAWKFSRRRIPILLLLTFATSLATAQWAAGKGLAANFYLLPMRGWELLIGSLISPLIMGDRNFKVSKSLEEAGGLLGIFLIAYAIFAFDMQTPYPSVFTLLPTVGTALVIYFGNEKTVAGKLLGNRLFVGIGIISYSAYLWHQPLLAFAKHRFSKDLGLGLDLLLVALTFGLAFLSWKYVETPFRNRSRFGRKQIFLFGFAGSLFFIAMGVLGNFKNGFEDRMQLESAHQGDTGQFEFFQYITTKNFPCLPKEIEDQSLRIGKLYRCAQSKKNENVDVVLLGDSHAEHVFPGLALALANKNVAFYIKSSFPYYGNPEFDAIFKQILSSPSIKQVILTMHWIGRIQPLPEGLTLEAEISKMAEVLHQAGKEIYVLGDVPSFPFSAERCKFKTVGLAEPLCKMKRKEIERVESRQMPPVRASVSKLKYINYAELDDLFCDESSCSMVKGEELLYRDDHHLNLHGSNYLGKAIVRKFPQLQ